MSRQLTSDEVRQDYIAKMGTELGSQFNELHNECAWLHLKWAEYVALFGEKTSRVDLLNASAAGFFALLESSLWDDVLLHICRLSDEPEVGRRKRQTLTVRRLPELVDPKIRQRTRRLVSAAVKKREFARDWRNRRIAHRDLELALKEGAKPLDDASRQSVQDAIGAIRAVLGAVEEHYRKQTTGYEYVSHLGDAVALLHVLRDGVEARHQRLRPLEAGPPSPSDLMPKPPI
jgi:hypothetical protein